MRLVLLVLLRSISNKSRRRSIAAARPSRAAAPGSIESASEDPGRGNVRRPSMPPSEMKKTIGAAAPETQTKNSAVAHVTATSVKGQMDVMDATKLTRTREELGVSGLTPGRDPILRNEELLMPFFCWFLGASTTLLPARLI